MSQFKFIGTAERHVKTRDGGVAVTFAPTPAAAPDAIVVPTNGGRLVVGPTVVIEEFDPGFDYLNFDADFEAVTFGLDATVGAHGKIVVEATDHSGPYAGRLECVANDVLSVTVTPDASYAIATITVDGVALVVGNPAGVVYDFDPFSQSHTFAVTFVHT